MQEDVGKMLISTIKRAQIACKLRYSDSGGSNYRGVESSTMSFINFSILGSNNRFFDKLYDCSWSESSIYIAIHEKLKILKSLLKITTFCGFSLIYLMIFWI